MIFVKQKPKFSERPIRKERIPREPIRTKKETSKLRKARENARDKVVIGFNFTSDRLRE